MLTDHMGNESVNTLNARGRMAYNDVEFTDLRIGPAENPLYAEFFGSMSHLKPPPPRRLFDFMAIAKLPNLRRRHYVSGQRGGSGNGLAVSRKDGDI